MKYTSVAHIILWIFQCFICRYFVTKFFININSIGSWTFCGSIWSLWNFWNSCGAILLVSKIYLFNRMLFNYCGFGSSSISLLLPSSYEVISLGYWKRENCKRENLDFLAICFRYFWIIWERKKTQNCENYLLMKACRSCIRFFKGKFHQIMKFFAIQMRL